MKSNRYRLVYSLIIYVLFNISNVLGQTNNLKPLKVGDSVPNITLGEVLNHPNLKTARFSDFKGRLLILDFWGSFCAPCIAGLPKMYELQQEFKDQIVILPVAVDGEKARRLIDSWRGTAKEMKLATVLVNDVKTSDLIKCVPGTSLPHEVWIDADGVIIAITGADAVNSKNIRDVIEGKIPPFTQKVRQRYLYLDEPEPIYLKPLKKEKIYGTAFAGYTDSVYATRNEKIDTSGVHLVHINSSMLYLYNYAYTRLNPMLNKKLTRLNDVKNSLVLERKAFSEMDNFQRDEFHTKSQVCYESILPSTYSIRDAYKWMIADLDRFFKVESKVEHRKVRCLSLVRTSAKDKIRSRILANGRDVKNDFKNGTLIYQNCTIDFLVQQLDSKFKLDDVFIDGTGYKNNIHIVLPEKLESIKDLKVALKKYDLDLVEVERELPVLILNNNK